MMRSKSVYSQVRRFTPREKPQGPAVGEAKKEEDDDSDQDVGTYHDHIRSRMMNIGDVRVNFNAHVHDIYRMNSLM
jgi:hypothetical protein